MKNLLLITLSLFSIIAQAGEVKSFVNVSVNTLGSPTNKVEASVHIVSELPLTPIVAQLAAREIIAKTLSSFKARELVSSGAIESIKHNIFKEIKSNNYLTSYSITEVFVTDIVVSSVGNPKVAPVVIPTKN